MKTLLLGSVLAATSIVGQATLPTFGSGRTAFVLPATSELSALRALDGGRLSGLRAGRVDAHDSLNGSERSRMLRAQQQSPELGALRAGEVSSVLLTILVVVAIVAIVLIII